jgi:hypothetical protein
MSDPAALAGTITGIFSPERAGNILDKIWNEDIAQQFVDSLGH